MMRGMEVVLVALLVLAAAAIAWLLAGRRAAALAPPVTAAAPAPVVVEVPQALVQQAVAAAVAQANERAAAEVVDDEDSRPPAIGEVDDVRPDRLQHLEPAHSGHLEVGDHEIENFLLHLRDRFIPVRGHGHGISGALEHDAQHIAQALLIIDD